MIREATQSERHTFLRWLVNGEPVAPHLLAEGLQLRVNTEDRGRFQKIGNLDYVINIQQIRIEVKAIGKGER